MVDGAGHESAWVSAHAFFQSDLDLLVKQVVAPLVDEFAARRMASDFFFLRYWEGGPHLRLRVRPAAGVSPVDVRRVIAARFGQYLSRNPSAERMSAAQYEAVAPQLALREQMRSWTAALYPNNSVSFIAYRREHERYGHGASIQAVERHFVESSRIALRVVTLAAPAERRATLALACILVAWFVGHSDRGSITMWPATSYRKGAEYLGTVQIGELARTVELARTARHLAEGGPAARAEGVLTRWTRSMTDLRAALSAAEAAEPGSGGNVGPVLDLCAHLVCNRLGISVLTEAALRNLAAQAVDSLHTERSRPDGLA
ncbi:thiopeptide-type bacteriocin biosynthesis protein [Dactylosporangium sp. NPDC051541]|uniref:thiopeptide-type bacteriocin biosynthesis protein n=1 Tax=Dactylosporangium sp. NPDC051541 TaxID=3363977 RepID=UPI0037BB6852